MKIPRINTLGYFGVFKKEVCPKPKPSLSNLKQDTVSFCASTAYYLKKYKTLPDEIKKVLSPKDAIDMFMDMEFIQRGLTKGRKIGQGNNSRVYENPWLKDYAILISHTPEKTTHVVYSRHDLGDSVWSDRDNDAIQLIKKAG